MESISTFMHKIEVAENETVTTGVKLPGNAVHDPTSIRPASCRHVTTNDVKTLARGRLQPKREAVPPEHLSPSNVREFGEKGITNNDCHPCTP